MLPFRYVAVFAVMAAVACAQEYDYDAPARPAPSRVQPGYSGNSAPKAAPIAILKQINRHNEDGSYTYGYEGADGSFKIETKLPTGDVKGKYGYVDDTGKVRVVEYGATKYGFEPSGEGITVAPPTLVDETTSKDGTLLPEFAGNYYDDSPAPSRYQAPAPRPRPAQQPQFDFGAPQQFAQPSRAPVPQRAVVPGAAPVSSTQHFDFGPQPTARSYAPRSAPRPAPIQEYEEAAPAPRVTYAQPQTRPQSRPQPHFAPQPQFEPQQQQYAPRPSAPQARATGGGILDQLSKDYALPQGGAAALHDISFGYY